MRSSFTLFFFIFCCTSYAQIEFVFDSLANYGAPKREALNKDIERRYRALEAMEGLPAPDFIATSTQGEQYRLDEYLGQVVVLLFWSTRDNFMYMYPNSTPLNQFFEKYSDQGAAIITLCAESEKEISYITNRRTLLFPVIPNAKSYLKEHYGANRHVLPTVLIIDKMGIIRRVYNANHQVFPPIRYTDIFVKVDELLLE